MRNAVFYVIFFLLAGVCAADEFEVLDGIPVAYKGRFRPLDAAKTLSQNENLWQEHFKKLPPTEGSVAQQLRAVQAPPFALPSKAKSGEWLSLRALKVQGIGNFTVYPDALFEKIRTAYVTLENAEGKEIAPASAALSALLMEGYAPLAGTPYTIAANKKLSYPTMAQLKAESLYYKYPWPLLCCLAYAAATLLWIVRAGKMAMAATLLAFTLNTFLLAIRCYILQRPPVSSMFETVLFVPWVATSVGFLLAFTTKSQKALAAATAGAAALFAILLISGMPNDMENVQAVLDSQYWLTIHVLMVVGSYGVFVLAGLLGHVSLIHSFFRGDEKGSLLLNKLLLQSLYIGTALLVVGTILGGIWAAQSWGRFWDWDPKESWAFISASMYLICIHAYRFNKIGPRGLAVGAIAGLLAITFTWYGVNYILGTGLHSYGFGAGGESLYYGYLIAELLFLGGILLFPSRNSLRKKS